MLDVFSRTAASDPVVVRSKYGNLTNNELKNLEGEHHALVNFVESIAHDLASNGIRPRNAWGFLGQLSPQEPKETEEENVVDFWLLAQERGRWGRSSAMRPSMES